MTVRAVLDLSVSEKDFQQAVIDLARLHKWMVHHAFDSRRSEAGLPDLLLVRPETDVYPGQIMFVELKSEKGRVSAAQVRWLRALQGAHMEVHIWRPSSWPEIVSRLKRKHSLPFVDEPAVAS